MLFQVRLWISVSVKHKHALEEGFANTASRFLLTLESETETRENPHPCVCTDVWHLTLYKLQKLVTEVVSRFLEPSTKYGLKYFFICLFQQMVSKKLLTVTNLSNFEKCFIFYSFLCDFCNPVPKNDFKLS